MSSIRVEITENDGEVGKILARDFSPPHRSSYSRFGVEKVVLPTCFLRYAKEIETFEVRDDDVWVISHPKTGTTWTQEMVWCVENELDFVGAQTLIHKRFSFLEISALFDREIEGVNIDEVDPSMRNSVKFCHDLKSPRYIKTHLPWQMLPKQLQTGIKKPKIIYVARNAKDTCLSYYHHCLNLEGYTGNFADFITLFLGDSVNYAPFWPHLLAFWERREKTNVLFLKFEDMKKDLPSVIRETADFLGKPLTESQVAILADHLSFAKMKVNPAVNYEDICKNGKFMRKGEVDQWKADMTPELIKEFDSWTQLRTKGTGLPY